MITKILVMLGLLPDPRLSLRPVNVVEVNVGDILYEFSTVQIVPPNLPDLRKKAALFGWQGSEDFDKIEQHLTEQKVSLAYDYCSGWKIFEPKSSS